MSPQPEPLLLQVIVWTTASDRRDFTFGRPFRIGRADECDVCIKDEHVSRSHAEVFFENAQWWVRDLNSSNGIFTSGQRVPLAAVGQSLTIRLGIQGPFINFVVDLPAAVPPAAPVAPATVVQPVGEPQPVAAGSPNTVERYIQHYFGGASSQPAGAHTMMVRRAFQHVQARQKKKHGIILAALLAVVLAVAGYGLYLRRQVRHQQAMAQDLFYATRAVDVDLANLERLVADTHNRQGEEALRRDQSRRADMEANYDRFLAMLHTYDAKMPEQKRLILRVARIFGECELAMPPQFTTEIEGYIKKWRSSGRLAEAVRTAQEHGYTELIAKELLAQDLPPQFFYLALQESGFYPYISGPPTRLGIAKGMWQFIPPTALKYGLHLGPLVDLRRPDPGDDRHHWERETKAAARYLKDLYTTDAQASGLLVMACYNWGEDRVLPLVRSMPANPRERNFWRLLALYRNKVPQETYDYVFSIASAAVIGENPRLFGFDFDNPLGRLESKQ